MEIWLLIGGSLLGFGISYLLQKLSYKDEYYKKLIDKRLQAYELVEIVLGKMKRFGETLDMQGFHPYHAVFATEESRAEFYVLLLKANEKSYLFSKELDSEFKSFGYFVYGNIYPPSEVKETAIKHFIVLQKHCENIESLIKKDLKELHKVEPFLNEERIKLSEVRAKEQQSTDKK
ncbi:MAG: hypothetical protein L0Y79_12655 [Chlorobi bacterium]|nr:hypothetical protein [Chlorobiota bacterium]MCI0715031.1 hypothetical protein [Chlorobiota bacterium]